MQHCVLYLRPIIITILILFLFQFQVEVAEEYVIYNLPDFIGDFGGYLGLFLGWSVQSILLGFIFKLKEIFVKFRWLWQEIAVWKKIVTVVYLSHRQFFSFSSQNGSVSKFLSNRSEKYTHTLYSSFYSIVQNYMISAWEKMNPTPL